MDINQEGPGLSCINCPCTKSLRTYISLDKAVGCQTAVWCQKILHEVF